MNLKNVTKMCYNKLYNYVASIQLETKFITFNFSRAKFPITKIIYFFLKTRLFFILLLLNLQLSRSKESLRKTGKKHRKEQSKHFVVEEKHFLVTGKPCPVIEVT